MSPAVITLLVLLVMVVFFVTEKLPAALVSMLGGSVLVLCGIIEPAQLFSAFSGSTIVLIAAMMVVGSTLFHTASPQRWRTFWSSSPAPLKTAL